MEGMKIKKMFCAFMSRFATATVMCGITLSQCLSAAILNVEFDVRTRAAESDPAYKRNSIAIFVLDRSESMTWPPANGERAKNGKVARNRNQIFRESFQDRIRTMSENEPNTKVFVLEFSNNIKPFEGPFALNSPNDVERLLSWEGLEDYRCKGKTLLYDARERALEKAEELYLKDPSAKVELFVYTDGDNDTPPSGFWYRKILDENGREQLDWLKNPKVERVRVRYSSRDNVLAKRRFDEKWADKKAAYSKSGKLELHWRWLGKGNPPPGIEATKDEYPMMLTADAVALKNPKAASEQTLPVALVIPLPSQLVPDLEKMNATLAFEIGGKNVVNKLFSLSPGKKTISIQVPDDIPTGNFEAKLKVSDVPDMWERVALKSPPPLDVYFTAPDKVTFLALEPRGDVFVKTGQMIYFTARASEGAAIEWIWKGGACKGQNCPISFSQNGTHIITVKASKNGFLPAEDIDISVHAIDAEVGVGVVTARPQVGENVDFVAKVRGRPESFSWWVDGQSVSSKESRLKGCVFNSSGKHIVKVQAYYGHGIFADSGDFAFDVAVKPSIVITDPVIGCDFGFGEKIKCQANVEGDFDKVVWKIDGPISKEIESVVDKGGRNSRVIFNPVRGGAYKLMATASGAAGTLNSKTVSFSVKREDVMVRIDRPVSGASAEVGKDLEMKASVKGQLIKEVKWTVGCKGKALFSAKKPVQGGMSSCVFKPSVALGNGSVLVITAEDAADEKTSSTVDVETSFFAALNIVSAKVGNRDANGLQASFGDQVVLEASCNDGVDASKIEWVAEIAGKEKVIGNGLKVNAPKVSPGSSAFVTARYFARAKLPDGSTISTGKITVFFACDEIIADIVLPKGGDGLVRRSFKPGEAIHMQLVANGGRLTDVEWNFGDGVIEKGDNVEHAFSDEKSHAISAKGKCVKCGKVFGASVEVSTACPDLELAVVLPKGDDGVTSKQFGLGKQVNVELAVKDGEAKDVIWDFGDGTTAKGSVASHAYGKYGKYKITASAKCERCNKLFAVSSEDIEVAKIPPKAILEIKEKGSHYGTGDTIHLSAEKSSGDIVDYIWEIDGKEQTEDRGKQEIKVKLPKKPCEMVVKLTLIGPDGATSETQRDVRVRWGAVVIVLLLLLVALAVGVLARLLWGNGPAGWTAILYCCEPIDHSTDKGKDKERGKLPQEGGVAESIPLRKYWNFWDKTATIPLEKISSTTYLEKLSTFINDNCKDKVIVVCPKPDGDKYRDYVNLDLSEVSDGFDAGINFMFYQYKGGKTTSQKPNLLRVVIDRSKNSHRYEICFMALTLLVIAAAFWAALKYAI